MEERTGYSRFSATMMGALLVFLGVAVLANTGDVTAFVVQLAGFACVTFALVIIAGHLLTAHSLDAIPFGELIGAGALLLVGAVVSLFPDAFAKVLFSVMGVLVIISGVGDIVRSHAVTADDEDRERTSLRIGIITVAAGAFITFVPSAAVHAIPVVCGLVLVVDGLSELYLALRMHDHS